MKLNYFTVLLPIACIIIIGIIMVGLGAIFTILGKSGTIYLGIAIILVTALIGFLLNKKFSN